MRKVFADAFYWIAMANPGDAWHQEVRRVTATLARVPLVTTEEVLTEFLAWFAERGISARQQAVSLVRSLLAQSHIQVLHQSHDTFLDALDLYERRLDKEYSLVDCASMIAMRTLGITEVLTHDHHFTQEGFQILFR